MSDAPPKQILTVDGMKQETLEWLQSESAAPVISLAAQLIKQQQWALVRLPDRFEHSSLWVGTRETGVVFLAKPLLNTEQVREDQERVMQQMPSDWTSAHVVYLSEVEPAPDLTKALEHKERKTLSTKVVTSSAVSVTQKTAWGSPNPQLKGALLEYSPTDLTQMLELMLGHQNEMAGFLERVREVNPWASYGLIVLCVLTFGWAETVGNTTDNWTLLRFGANFAPLTIGAGQWWRLLGAAFLHIGWVHILVNMYSLYAVGPTLERFFGNLRFLGVYTLSALFGSLASAFFGGGHISAGASGAIFGLFGAAVVLGLRHKTAIPKPIQQQLVKGMLPAIGYNLAFGFSQSGIDNSAHLGGLLAGSLAAAAIPPRIALPRLGSTARGVLALLAAFLIGNQLFVLGQAARGFRLSELPSREIKVGAWTVSLPELFSQSENGEYFEGPGINVDLNGGVSPVGGDKLSPQQLAERLSRESGIALSFDRSAQVDGRTWHFFRSSQGVAGTIALTVEGNEEFAVITFCSLEYPQGGAAVADFLVSTVRRPSKEPSPGSTN